MKRLTTLIFLILISIFACNDDNPEPEITEANYSIFDGSIGISDNSTIVSSDNNLIICGNANNGGLWTLIKITKLGKELWRKDFAGDDWLSSSCALAETENGDLFVCGVTHRNWDNSMIDILLVKTNKDGDTLWTKTYGGSENDYSVNIIKTSDSNILMSGWSGTDSVASGDINLFKLDYNGNTLWTKTYTNPEYQFARHLLETKNGEYLITGGIKEGENPSELYLLKVDADGTKLWDRKIGPASGKNGLSAIEVSNGDLVICGFNTAEESENRQLLLVKTDNLGNTIWEKEFGNDETSEIGYSIKQNIDGSYTITGSYDSTGMHMEDIILLQTDQDGNQVWFKKFGGPETDRGMNLIKDSNDDNLITGDFNRFDNIFLTRTDNNGNFK